MANDQRLLDFMLKTTEQYSTMLSNLSSLSENFVKILMDCLDGSRVGREFRNEPLSAYYAESVEQKEMISRMLTKQGIPFITTRTNSGRDAFIVRQKDSEALFAMNRAFVQSRQAGLITKDAVMIRGDGKVKSYEGLSFAQISLFLRKAEEKGIGVAAWESEQGKYTLFFAQKDAVEMVKISSSVAYDLSGKSGDFLRRQMEYYENRTLGIAERAAWPEQGADFYIVGRNGDIAYCNAVSFTYEKGGVQTRIQSAKHEQEVNAIVALMDRPVELSLEQFHAYARMKEKERQGYLDRIDKEQGCPVATKEEEALLASKEASRSLVEKKLLQANPEQIYATKALTDDVVSVDSFIDAARDNWEQQHDLAQAGVNDPVLFDDARAIQSGFIFNDEPYTGDTFYVGRSVEELDLADHAWKRDMQRDILDDHNNFEIPSPEDDFGFN